MIQKTGCPARLNLQKMGIEGKVDFPARPQNTVLVHRESWWLEPGLRRVKEEKEDGRRTVLRAAGLLSKVDTGPDTRKEVGTIKDIFPPFLGAQVSSN